MNTLSIFVTDNWGKLSALVLGLGHFFLLHKQAIASTYEYVSEHGGIRGIISTFLNGKPAQPPKTVQEPSKPALPLILLLGLLSVSWPVYAQTIAIQNPIPSMPTYAPGAILVTNTFVTTNIVTYSVSNAPSIGDVIGNLIAAIKSTNTYWAAYGIKYSGDPQSVTYKGKSYQLSKPEYGAGIRYVIPQGDYLDFVGGIDWCEGGLFSPSCNATLGYPMALKIPFAPSSWPKLNVKPFILAGVGIPISGAQFKVAGVSLTIPGSGGNGQPFAITGAGCAVTIHGKLMAVYSAENWTVFKGIQQRAGLMYQF